MSTHFPRRDVEALLGLFSRVASLRGANHQRLRTTLIAGLAEIVGARAWLWHLGRMDEQGRPTLYLRLDGGWRDDSCDMHLEHINQDPEFHRLNSTYVMPKLKKHLTARRTDLFPGKTWVKTAFYREHGVKIDMGHFIWSIYLTTPTAFSSIGLYRSIGEPDFTPAERDLVHAALAPLDWLHREGTEMEGAKLVTQLPPRERTILHKLVRGEGVKEIALRLGISRHTVNDYVKSLYRRFDVASRSELLAKFISGNGAPEKRDEGSDRPVSAPRPAPRR